MLDYLEYGDLSPTTLWEFESQIPTRQVGVIDHFTIGSMGLVGFEPTTYRLKARYSTY